MRVIYYQAVWIDSSGGFRVNGAVSKDRDEAIRMCSKHTAVKAGAKLHWIDSWYEDI